MGKEIVINAQKDQTRIAIVENGDPAQKVDLLLLGDGYTSDEREAFLQRACQGDSALCERVKALLRRSTPHDRPQILEGEGRLVRHRAQVGADDGQGFREIDSWQGWLRGHV